MEKNMTKNERKRRRKLSAKLATMLGLPIAVTSCGPVDNVSNVGTNYEEPKKTVIEQETTEKTTADMTIEEILTTRKSSTINNTVTTANNSYNDNDNGYTNNDYYYDDTVYLDPEEVMTENSQVNPTIPSKPSKPSSNKHQTQQSGTQSTQGSTQKPTKPETKPTSKPTTNESKPTTKTETPTSKKTTTKTTTKTTKKTTITTTTTTTTTKKPETTTTQAPVIEEPEYREYTLEDIRANHGAFELYAQYLTNDLMAGNAMSMSYTNYTAGGRESVLLLAMLNEGEISDEVLGKVFSDYTYDDMKNYTEFIYSIADIQEMFGTDVDFSKYTLNYEIGTYINDIDNAYRNGGIEDFLYNAYMNGEMIEGGWGHPAIESMLCSYDTNNIYGTGQDLNIVFMDSYMENLYKKIETTKGISYTR